MGLWDNEFRDLTAKLPQQSPACSLHFQGPTTATATESGISEADGKLQTRDHLTSH
jgi:hypothetical protein